MPALDASLGLTIKTPPAFLSYFGIFLNIEKHCVVL